ncbi:MAG: hypothetical protein SPL12_10805, partial [Bacteroidales bacterium]|nr:hypothetical protein [Bacteroidales bacterium]
VTACNRYLWHGTEYTASTDTATYQTTNAVGCDSTVTLHLTIEYCSTTSITACDSYEWHGTAYTESGTYADGTDTLLLTIYQSTASTATETACDSYSWNGTAYTESGSYTYSTTNAAGCDSTVTLHLTIGHSYSDTLNVTAENSYDWHGSTYTESGSYTYAGVTEQGCDSVVTLLLTIEHVIATYQIEVRSESPEWGYATGGGQYEHGQSVTLEANAYEGYRFAGWTDGDTTSPRTIVVTGDSTFVATFAEKVGVNEATGEDIVVVVCGHQIVVKGAEAMETTLYTVDGRVLYKGQLDGTPLTLPASGVYMLKIGDLPARRILAIR